MAKGLWVTYDKGKEWKTTKRDMYVHMFVYFIYDTYHIVPWEFTILLLGQIGRQLVNFKAPLVAAIIPYLILPTHRIHAC